MQATALHKTGQLKDAEAQYVKCLTHGPNADALHQYGVLLVELYGIDQVSPHRSDRHYSF